MPAEKSLRRNLHLVDKSQQQPGGPE